MCSKWTIAKTQRIFIFISTIDNQINESGGLFIIYRIIWRRQERKTNLDILKRANIFLIKYFNKVQGVEAANTL